MNNIASTIIVAVCVIGFVATIVLLIQLVKRQSNFIMSFKSTTDYQLTTNNKISQMAEADIKRQQEDDEWEAYNEIIKSGVVSDDDIKRFGIHSGVTE